MAYHKLDIESGPTQREMIQKNRKCMEGCEPQIYLFTLKGGGMMKVIGESKLHKTIMGRHRIDGRIANGPRVFGYYSPVPVGDQKNALFAEHGGLVNAGRVI